MLCEPKQKQGLIGSFYFIGMLIGMLILPKLADTYGRKRIIVLTMLTQIIAQTGLIFSNNLDLGIFFMMILGSTFSGK